MSPIPLSIRGIVDVDQYMSSEQQKLFRQIVDPETEGALFFIAYSTIFIITCRLLYYSLKGTYLHKKLLEYIILSVIPQLGEQDWPHQDTIVIPPKSGEHNSTLFFLHGLGDGSGYWEHAVKGLNLMNTKIILPAAPRIPVTVNMKIKMPAWFDVIGTEIDSPEDDEGIYNASLKLSKLIEHEINNNEHISPNNIMISGFSQGGAVALNTTYRNEFLKYKVGCVVVFSSFMPRPRYILNNKECINKINLNTHCFLGHGTDDGLVKYVYGLKTGDMLKDRNVPVNFNSYDGVGHQATEEMLSDASDFLRKQIKTFGIDDNISSS